RCGQPFMAGICEANVLTPSFPKPFSVFEKSIKLRFSTYQNHREQYVSGGFSIFFRRSLQNKITPSMHPNLA
ncbi:hypothetical protein, partial [Anaerotignum lactatifermentans]|uniref:hypothetical protein n=1 Tax=Anaerotignum lactatifermentans TaxID=160404 RepID=UPI00248D4A7A